MARADKAAAVAEITEEFRASSAAVLTEYRGLSVGQLKELRRSLGADTTYAVVKNTLSKIAAKDAGVQGFDELLVGPTAIAFIKGDPVTAAKGLDTFAKENPLLVIKGGVLDGKVLTADDVKKLAKLESREVLLSKVAGAANAAMAKAAALFQAPLSQAARTVDALRAKVEAEGPAVASAPAESSAEVATEEVATETVDSATEVAQTEVATEASAEVATDAAEVAEEAPAEAASEESAEASAEAETTEG
ncbi:MAG: 50S ribosomal protein L10 [Actinobacteria bacterium]|nr:50S ribosomal protein L10 [Actinomycetota bacterium]